MNAQSVDWSDIPFVLAVCEAGTLSGAARKLGVNHSTVFRRIEGVQKKLGVTLFERLSHGYVMTTAGEHFFRNAVSLEEGFNRIQRELGGQDLRLEGPLAVTTTDSLLHRLIPVFLAFQQQYPDIELQLLAGTRSFDLMQREADIALRPTLKPPEHWIGRRLLPIAVAVYAHADYVKAMQSLAPQDQRWIKVIGNPNQTSLHKITALYRIEGAPVTISSSLMGVFDLVRAGLGIAALPCYLGENCPELVRIREPDPEFNTDLWILAHPDIRRSARVHAFFEFATAKVREGGNDFFSADGD